jgi:hypothetical protein
MNNLIECRCGNQIPLNFVRVDGGDRSWVCPECRKENYLVKGKFSDQNQS